MIRLLLALALALGFWIPPFVIGRWVGGTQRGDGLTTLVRLVAMPALLIMWTVAWFLTLLWLAGPYERRGPGDPADAPAMLAMSLLMLGLVLVLPVSAVACRHGYRRGRQRSQSSEARQPSVDA